MPALTLLDDELALILGKGCEHVQHQPSGRGCRVDAIGDGPDLDTAAAQQGHSVEHVYQ